ncbi:43252_t:CDS:2, partial [Gigaspora margarita]
VEKSSEAVKNFWILIDKKRFKHEIENIQLNYAKRVLNDTNNKMHQIHDISTNNAIKTLKHTLEGDENNKEKKKKSASGKEERAHCSDISHTIPSSQQSKLFNNDYNTPSPMPPMLVDRINNPFIVEDEVDDIFIIDYVNDIWFIGGNSADDYKIDRDQCVSFVPKICGVIFVGELSPPSERNNVYKNCKDLIRVGIFMKDCLDSCMEKGTSLKVLGFQCVDEFIVNEIETLLRVREIFCKSFGILYSKLCIPSPLPPKTIFKRNTLSTPKFNQL